MNPALRLAQGAVTGLVTVYVLLAALQGAGVTWRPLVIALAMVLSGAAAWALGRSRGDEARPLRLGWGDGVALAFFGIFAACAALLWNLHPDFIYHWGIKGARFHLAGGVDLEFLASPWNGHLHPDYPNLLPSLYAATATLVGFFCEVAMASWSVLFYLLTLLFSRELLRRLDVSDLGRQAGLATLSALLTMFGVGYLTAGGADWLLVVAIAAGAVALVGRLVHGGGDLALGMAAALAAGSKIEGMPLAAFLVAVYLALRLRNTGAPPWSWLPGALLKTIGPPATVVGLWAWQVLSLDLFQPTNTGGFDSRHVAIVFPELFRSLLTVNWHGLSFVLLALPLLLLPRATRAVAAVLCLQLAFYVFAYLSASVDPREWIRTSAARLFFHLVPAALLLAVVAIDRWSTGSLGDASAECG